MDGAAVPGSDEAGAFDFDYFDADGFEPLGCLGVSGGDEDLHGLQDYSGLGAPLHGELAFVSEGYGSADFVGGCDEVPVHLGLHPLEEVGVEGAGVLDASVAVDEGVVADSEAGAVAGEEAYVDFGVLGFDDVGELLVAPFVGAHDGWLGGVGSGVVD